MFEPLVTAFRTLTILPLPGRDSDHPASALPMFPVVGIVIGIIQYTIARGCGMLFSDAPMIGGLLVTAAVIGGTGALHLDGFADVADGFGGGRTRERILEIFKDSRHGTYGVAAIVFSIAGRTILTSWCIDFRRYELLVLAPVVSRTVQAWACTLLPYGGRATGEGASAFFTGGKHLFLTAVSVLCLAGFLIVFRPVWYGVAVLIVPLLPVTLFFIICKRTLGGLTGDCLGAANEMAELSALFAGAALNGIVRLP